jgi:hypothetical protein
VVGSAHFHLEPLDDQQQHHGTSFDIHGERGRQTRDQAPMDQGEGRGTCKCEVSLLV